jgi:ATP-dependent Lon protease
MDSSPQDDELKQARDATPEPDGAASRSAEVSGDPDQSRELQDMPDKVPVLPVRNVVIFPGTVVPLSVGREKSRRLIDTVLEGSRLVATFTQRNEETEDPGIDDVYRVGTVARVLKLLRMPDGNNSLLVHGVARAGLVEFTDTDPFWQARIEPHEDTAEDTKEIEALVYNARRTAEQVLELSPNVPEEARVMLSNIDRAGALADFLAANLSLGVVQKQEFLETFDVKERLHKVIISLNNQLELLQLNKKIQTDVRGQIDKTQRQYFLQEQLRAIQKELGETEGHGSEVAELRTQVEQAGMPELVLKEAERELDRLERIPQASPEYSVARDYIGWLVELPWQNESAEILDVERAEEILEADHHGLHKIKQRILEFLAVRKLNPTGKSPILCFTGPPGVGKTSLGQSIARALNREFIRIALGGVRDEAEIRGHRRTYIGAIPGRLIQEIRKCGQRNPVVMLDELDKLGADFRGDPASALLEVLDPEQNSTFTDRYLDVPFDLSKVLFIGTANYVDPVPAPLKDRMEVIALPGYTTEEKLAIAKQYLVPRQLEANGLKGRKVRFDKKALQSVIENYTREAGVRNLERSIGAICRALAAKVARDQKVKLRVAAADVPDYLGPAKFEREAALRKGLPGVVTGLAYTPVGGEVMFVEALAMPGKGGFTLTGQIGDVMRESAQAALSLVKARGSDWKIDPERVQETDVHIHVPAGGVPKDGPSAGVAMLTALVSMFADEPADPSVAMTGEITLRGRVLPIGGVKEKVLAAHRAGVKKVLLPKQNENDLHEVPQHIRDELAFELVEAVDEVLDEAVPTLRGRASTPRAAGKKRSRKKVTRKQGQGTRRKRPAR